MSLEFYKEFEKDTKKLDGVSLGAPGPTYWISTGNYVLNKIISGGYNRGIAQGRLAMLTGPSGAGKSFLTGNIIKSAQDQGYGVFVLDSENALDDGYMQSIGVNTKPDSNYYYRGISTISQCVKIISSFIKSYRKNNETTPFLIVIDSLDMLLTDSMTKAYDDGDTKGDQGQHAKQLKAMLSPFMHDIKDLNISILCTKQVYKNQDAIAAKNPINEWLLTESIKFPFSQIALVTRLLLRDDVTRNFEGIKLKVFGMKTRFTKPFQQAMIEVPYDEGMDKFTGLLEVAESMGVVTRSGAWYSYGEQKFQSKNFSTVQESVLNELVSQEKETVLNIKVGDEYLEDGGDIK